MSFNYVIATMLLTLSFGFTSTAKTQVTVKQLIIGESLELNSKNLKET